MSDGNAQVIDEFRTLAAHPEVETEIGTETVGFEATELSAQERAPIWATITAENPGFADHEQKAAPRIVPLVRLRRT